MGELRHIGLAPPDDDDAAGWKKLCEQRSNEYNELAGQVEEAWAEIRLARSALATVDHTDGAEPLQDTALVAAQLIGQLRDSRDGAEALIVRLRTQAQSLRSRVAALESALEDDEQGEDAEG